MSANIEAFGIDQPGMKPTVYIETSIIGYLAMRGSSLLRVAADQQVSRDWWDNHRHEYDLFASLYVLDECSGGDPMAAQERLVYMEGISILRTSGEVGLFAKSLLAGVPLPSKAGVDALHIAIATMNRIEYLLTWNCKHIANLSLRPRIERICREWGLEPPVICTPRDLLEIENEF